MNIPVINHWDAGRIISVPAYIRLQSRLRKLRKESLYFTEHPPTITAGIQAKAENLLENEEKLNSKNIVYIRTERGGDHTAHEPGQLTVYIHLDLKKRNLKIGSFIKSVTESSVEAVHKTWGIIAHYNDKYPGLYAGKNGLKLSAIGLMIRNDFSSFGFTVNIYNSLSVFSSIIPCGNPAGKPVTVSQILSEETANPGYIADLRRSTIRFSRIFTEEFAARLKQ